MKKLFLYITIFALVFVIAFSISENFFDEHTKNNTKLTVTEMKDNRLETVSEESVIIDITTTEDIPEYDVSDVGETVDTINPSGNVANKSNYIVTIKNGYIIVYQNSVENIYEYTGIDAEMIKITDEEMYNRLKESVIFNTREELFSFLESIAG